jgi:hypothetical protein
MVKLSKIQKSFDVLGKRQRCHIIYVVILFVGIISSCSVAPIIESPRVRSGVKVEASMIHSDSEVKWKLNDSIMRGGVYNDELKYRFGENKLDIAPLVKFALADRVEFGGYFWWVLQNMGWDGRIKVSMFEKGTPQLFQNIAGAVIIGSKGFNGEWDECHRHWAGITLGTHQQFRKLDFEYILMPTAGMCGYKNIDDGLGIASVSCVDATLVTGVAANIVQRFYLSAALTVSKDFLRHYRIHSSNAEGIQIKRLVFDQSLLGFNVVTGCRFGSKKR